MLSQPFTHGDGIRDRLEVAGVAKHSGCEILVNLFEVFEQGPGGRFGDHGVSVIGAQAFFVGAVCDTDRKARQHERIQHLEFGINQWAHAMVAAHDMAG